MIQKAILLCITVYSISANGSDMCTFTEQEKEFFEFTESYPFSDKDYSFESVNNAQESLKAHEAGKEVKYYIHDNTVNIIEGGQLQKKMLKAEKELSSYIPKDAAWDRKQHELKYKYLKARKDYCDFRRSHYVIDW